MTEHIIEYVARDRTGITAVITTTGVIDVDTVIHNISSGHSGYVVRAGEWRRAPVRSLSVLGGAYLFANWDGSKRNNLHDVAFQAPTRPARPQGAGGFVAALTTALATVFGRDRRSA
jgi:acetylornithine deacetylase/succinyl-diaminopimelate desuccinylase-like protein